MTVVGLKVFFWMPDDYSDVFFGQSKNNQRRFDDIKIIISGIPVSNVETIPEIQNTVEEFNKPRQHTEVGKKIIHIELFSCLFQWILTYFQSFN